MDWQLSLKDEITWVVCTGVVTEANVLGAAHELIAAPEMCQAPGMVWDMRKAKVGFDNSLFPLHRELTNMEGYRKDGRTAVLVNSELGYGLGREASAWGESAGRYVKVFREADIDQMIVWLKS